MAGCHTCTAPAKPGGAGAGVADVRRFREAHPNLDAPIPIVETRPLERDRLGALLLHCPNPHDALALGREGLEDILRKHTGRGGPTAVETILQMLSQAPLPPRSVAGIYAQRLQADYQAYASLTERIAATESDIAAVVETTDARFVDEVPGISTILAARYYAAIGNVARFSSAAQIWALAGFDPNSSESGDDMRPGHISRRGDPALRDTLFQIGKHTAQHCATIGHTYLAARERGMNDVTATIHAAHKANRLCFTLLRERRSYKPVTGEEQDAFENSWQSFWDKKQPR